MVQTLLLVAAADATGQASTVRKAAATLGVDATAWHDAERSGLLTITGSTVAVRHPLVRSAVYQAATSFEQRQVHRALADAVGADDPDRATWHRAAAAGRSARPGLSGSNAESQSSHSTGTPGFSALRSPTTADALRGAVSARPAPSTWREEDRCGPDGGSAHSDASQQGAEQQEERQQQDGLP